MYDLSDPSEPITGLLMEPFPDKQNKFYVLATTPRRYVHTMPHVHIMYMYVAVHNVYIKYCYFTITGCRIYQFIGTTGRSDGPVFSELFAHYDNIKGTSIRPHK